MAPRLSKVKSTPRPVNRFKRTPKSKSTGKKSRSQSARSASKSNKSRTSRKSARSASQTNLPLQLTTIATASTKCAPGIKILRSPSKPRQDQCRYKEPSSALLSADQNPLSSKMCSSSPQKRNVSFSEQTLRKQQSQERESLGTALSNRLFSLGMNRERRVLSHSPVKSAKKCKTTSGCDHKQAVLASE